MEQRNEITAEDILTFWFGDHKNDETTYAEEASKWFKKDTEFDALIRAKFASHLQSADRGQLDSWKDSTQGQLALILMFDQFPRNIYRDTPMAFAFDAKALALSTHAIEKRSETAFTWPQKTFLYMPLMHAEDRQMQAECVAQFARLTAEAPPSIKPKLEHNLRYAKLHQEVIDRFGRFPHRNAILGRTATPEETEFLTQPGSSF